MKLQHVYRVIIEGVEAESEEDACNQIAHRLAFGTQGPVEVNQIRAGYSFTRIVKESEEAK